MMDFYYTDIILWKEKGILEMEKKNVFYLFSEKLDSKRDLQGDKKLFFNVLICYPGYRNELQYRRDMAPSDKASPL